MWRVVDVRVLDLFSGIGGFSLGLERAGMETVAFCEIEKYPRRVLKKHWPDIPIASDIRLLSYNYETRELIYDGRTIYTRPIDVVCGGFPCQPFSAAGKRRGIEDDRYLWPEMFRLVQEIRPTWFIGENVAGLTSMGITDSPFEVEARNCVQTTDEDNYHSVRTRQEALLFRNILSDFEREAYTVQAFVIPACAVDAPHRRDRIWIVAHANRERERTRFGELQKENGEIRQWDNNAQFGHSSQIMADTQGFTSNGIWENRSRRCRRTVRGCCGERGTNQWLPEPNVGRVANGVPSRVDRLKCVGNAVLPQIVEIFGRAIMQAEGK